MKNVVILLCLVYVASASAGFFSPRPERVGKEGVVIGIEDDNGNTKVKISPHEEGGGVFSSAKEKIKEASSSNVIPEALKKSGDNSVNQETREAANEAVEAGYMTAEEAKEAVKGGIGKVKDKVAQATQKASDKAREMKEKAAKGGIGKKIKERAAQATQKAARESKESLEDAASEVSGKAKAAAQEMVRTRGKKGLKRVLSYPISFRGVMHLLGFATAYGMCMWVTFASNYVLAKALPRHQLAMVQSRIYPLYFKAMASSVGLALLAGYVMDKPFVLGIFRGYDLLASLVMILVNLFYLEPRATKVLFERMRKEKEEGGGEVDVPTGGATDLKSAGGDVVEAEAEGENGKLQNVRNALLGRLNSYSSLLNIATLMSLTWHLVHLGNYLHAEC